MSAADALSGAGYTLSKNIWAIQLLPSQNGTFSVGPLGRIPKGAQLQICGAGFNERTLKVCFHDTFYFLFREDLEGQQNFPTQARSAATG